MCCGFGLVMCEVYRREIVQQVIRSLLDIQLLRIIGLEPSWGYRIKKRFEGDFDVKLRHGALYPALNGLEARGFVLSSKQPMAGRVREVYTITAEGKAYLQAFYSIMQGQLEGGVETANL